MNAEPDNLVLVQRREFRSEMKALATTTDERFDRVEAHPEKTEAWQHVLDERLAAREERQKRFEARLEAIDGGLPLTAPAVDTADARLNRIQHEIAELRVAVHRLATAKRRHDDQIVDVHRRLAALEAAVGLTR